MSGPSTGIDPPSPAGSAGGVESRGRGPDRDALPAGGAAGPGSLLAFPHELAAERLPDNNLPLELTSFIGREREVAEVEGLLQRTRLLTLTGAGGSGKTRLALRVAGDLTGKFEDGVWLVELGPFSDQDLVPQAVAEALGVREQPGRPLAEALAYSLAPRRALLVLDNCEHLVDACARLVETLLGACPKLRILATSREVLGVGGERAWPVPSLSVPEADRSPLAEELGRYEAVSLFVERAEAMVPSFALTEGNARSVARVCRRLGGIPLAIELAAARVKVLSVEQIAERLDDFFRLLTSGSRTALPRQRTLRATIDWSHDLLSEEERVLFRRLSVFAGGFTLSAAEEVCVGSGLEHDEVLEVLSRLVEKSLVMMRERGGEARYRLLEMIRQYGQEKLENSGETQAVRRDHAAFFLGMAEEAEPRLTGAQQVVYLNLLEAELDNLRAAIGWSEEAGEPEMGLRFAGALPWFCYLSGRYGEGREWFEGVFARCSASPAPLRAKALYGVGILLFLQCDYERATALIQESADLYRELGDERGLAFALQILGCVEREQGRYARARALLEGSMAFWRGSGDEAGIADTLLYLAMVAWMAGDHERAEALSAEALAMFRRLGQTHGMIWSLIVLGAEANDRGDYEKGEKLLEESLTLSRKGYAEGVPLSLNQMGIAAYRRGEYERAAGLLKESLLLHREVDDRWRVASVLDGLAEVACAFGDHGRACNLFGAGEALRQEIGAPLPSFEKVDYERGVAAARAGLGEEGFAAAWSEGRAMTPDEAVEYALDKPTLYQEADARSVPAETAPAEAKATAPKLLRIFALGHARVERAGRVLSSSDWTYAKSRELLFYLLCHPPRTREQIGAALWPYASSSQLRKSFHDVLYRLRRALGAEKWVVFENGRYAFDRSLGYFFDVEAFESELAEARRLKDEAPEQAIHRLRGAIEVYGGDFLEDFLDSDWHLIRQEVLRREHHEALLSLGGLLLSEGRPAEAAEAYRKAISHDELLEEAHRGLMRSQAASGERGQAIRHYRNLVRLLEDELGSSPAPETRDLYESLRRSDGP